MLITGNGMADAKRKLNWDVDDDGRGCVPIDVCDVEAKEMYKFEFYISTGMVDTTMTAEALAQLGYTVSQTDFITITVIRVGYYDFHDIQVRVGSQNVLGAHVLCALDIHVSYGTNTFEVNISERLKVMVERGLNKTIRPAYKSQIKDSTFNAIGEWFTWSEIDHRFPNSWVLLWGGDDTADFGGEVLWHSETEIPETIQDNTFLYCNKSVATEPPFFVQLEDSIRLRYFAQPDEAFTEAINRHEGLLVTPTINRFYYDVISKQGKLFVKDKPATLSPNMGGGLLTQAEIDQLVAQFVM